MRTWLYLKKKQWIVCFISRQYLSPANNIANDLKINKSSLARCICAPQPLNLSMRLADSASSLSRWDRGTGAEMNFSLLLSDCIEAFTHWWYYERRRRLLFLIKMKFTINYTSFPHFIFLTRKNWIYEKKKKFALSCNCFEIYIIFSFPLLSATPKWH